MKQLELFLEHELIGRSVEPNEHNKREVVTLGVQAFSNKESFKKRTKFRKNGGDPKKEPFKIRDKNDPRYKGPPVPLDEHTNESLMIIQAGGNSTIETCQENVKACQSIINGRLLRQTNR